MALVVVSFAIVGYNINEQLIEFLLRPAKDQEFIYTTPGGGLNFIIQISIYFGIVIGIPMIVYHILRYLEPLLSRYDRGFVMKAAFLSAVLALSGMAFGYFVALPSALIFLGDQFHNDQVQALLTLSDYLSFVTIYMLGSALMFQIPIILLFANRVKPLSAKKLARSQRWVIIIAFIAAAIITPTPDLFNQAIIALPIILIYQVGVLLVASQNKYSKAVRANRLRLFDQESWQKRQQTAAVALPLETAEPLPDDPTDQEIAHNDAADSLTLALKEADTEKSNEEPVTVQVEMNTAANTTAASRTIPVLLQEDTSDTSNTSSTQTATRQISISQID